jgi:hypothetical protein
LISNFFCPDSCAGTDVTRSSPIRAVNVVQALGYLITFTFRLPVPKRMSSRSGAPDRSSRTPRLQSISSIRPLYHENVAATLSS